MAVKVFVELSSYNCEPSLNAVYDLGCELYQDTIREGYLVHTDPQAAVQLGCDHPDLIRAKALKWNKEICEEYRSALAAYQKMCSQSGQMLLNNCQTYRLKKATINLDGCFRQYCKFATAMNGDIYLENAVLTEEQVQAIQEHPENYAICELIEK